MSSSPLQYVDLLASLRRQNGDLRERVDRLEQSQLKKEQDLERLRMELKDSVEVKGLLKSKLKDCRSRLEVAIERYEEEVHRRGNCNISPDKKRTAFKIQELEDELNDCRSKLEAGGWLKEAETELMERKEAEGDLKREISELRGSKRTLQEALVRLEKENSRRRKRDETLPRSAGCSPVKHFSSGKENEEGKVRDLETELQWCKARLERYEKGELRRRVSIRVNNEEEDRPERSEKELRECRAECEGLREDLRLQKVEERLGEKKLKEAESRIKFLREVMLKNERDEKEKLEAKVVKLELEAAKKGRGKEEISSSSVVRDLKTEKEKCERELRKMSDEVERLKKYETKNDKLQSELDKALGKIDDQKRWNSDADYKKQDYETKVAKSKTELEIALRKVEEQKRMTSKAESQNESLKHTCLEQQDQIKEYQVLLAKMEVNNDGLKSDMEKIDKVRSSVKKLTEDNEELRSRLARKETEITNLRDGKKSAERRMEETNRQCDKISANLEKLRSEYLDAVQSLESVKGNEVQIRHLKDELSLSKSEATSVKESNSRLHVVMEEMLAKVESKNEEIKELKERLKEVAGQMERKEAENRTQINQLKKLIDHLQSTTAEERKGSSSSKSSRRVDWTLSYEEMQEELIAERKKNGQLREELQKTKSKSNPDLPKLRAGHAGYLAESGPMLKDNKRQAAAAAADNLPLSRGTDDLLSKMEEYPYQVADTGHSIPHRFQKQTNMRVQKCSVCLGNVLLCRAVSVCRFCHRVAHPCCETKVGEDCGLTSDLALVLKTNASRSRGISHKGFLRVPERNGVLPGKNWKKVAVQIVRNRLVIGDNEEEINLCPDQGFVFIQSTVAYTELLHTSAYEKPHVFKIGFSSGSRVKEAYYFMASTFQEKAAWIEAIEKATLQVETKKFASPSKSIAKCNVLAAFPTEINIFCALKLRDSVIFGTSCGLYVASANEGLKSMEKGPDSVFQMRLVKEFGEVIMIIGSKRKLVVVKEKDLMDCFASGRALAYRNIEVILACHLFEVGRCQEDQLHLCAVDDCRVSILVRDRITGEYKMRYGFSTDQPTSSIVFTSKSVLVTTDKIYEIVLPSFDVREFLNTSEDKSLASVFTDNHLVAMFTMGEDILICFQDYGMLVNENGDRSGQDLKWSNLSGQFFLSKSSQRLWMTYYNALEAIDLGTRSRFEMIQCKNPQIIVTDNSEELIFVDRKSDLLVVMEYNEML